MSELKLHALPLAAVAARCEARLPFKGLV